MKIKREPFPCGIAASLSDAVSAPLSAVLDRATMIRFGTGDRDEHARVIAASVVDVNELIREALLAVARALAAAPVRTDLAALVRQIVALHTPDETPIVRATLDTVVVDPRVVSLALESLIATRAGASHLVVDVDVCGPDVCPDAHCVPGTFVCIEVDHGPPRPGLHDARAALSGAFPERDLPSAVRLRTAAVAAAAAGGCVTVRDGGHGGAIFAAWIPCS